MKPTIEKLNEDTYIINKNKNFKTLFDHTYLFYNSFVKDIEKIIKKKYKEDDSFVQLITNIKSNNKVLLLTSLEIELLSNWIDSICKILLEKNAVDLKSDELNEYFKIASDFNKKVNKFLKKK